MNPELESSPQPESKSESKPLCLTQLKGKIAGCAALISIIIPFFTAAFLVKSAPNGFTDARKIAPNSLIKKAISENYLVRSNTIYPKAIKFKAENDLYVFDFNTPELCGISGCLYAIYTSSGTLVLSLYLQPFVNSNAKPKQKALPVSIFSADGKQNRFPCIAVTQFGDKSKHLVKTRYCYQGGIFVPVFQQLLEDF